jgi:hypothetical protein
MTDDPAELNFENFVVARKIFRERPGADAPAASNEDSNFVLYSTGPGDLFAVFEDFQGAGWFYLFDAKQSKVLKGLQVYNRAKVAVEEDVVDIGWAADDSACGLALWGQFRAFMGIKNDVEISKPVLDADEDGIPTANWPAGFEHYLEQKID